MSDPQTDRAASSSFTGPTQDMHGPLSVERTLLLDLEQTWALLTSPSGTKIWLNTNRTPAAGRGADYKSRDGTRGLVISYRIMDRIRLTWRPKKWDHDTILEVIVREGIEGTTVCFHQERLADAQEHEAMHAHWNDVLERLEAHVQTHLQDAIRTHDPAASPP